jgi:hypothetical protein
VVKRLFGGNQKVDQPKSAKTFERSLKRFSLTGYRNLKSPRVAVEKWRVDGFGWLPSDANGAPSLQMTCRLAFVDDLSLSGCRVKQQQ